MDLLYPFFQFFITKHGKENFLDIINTILNELDSKILTDLNISLNKYVQYIFAIATAQYIDFHNYKKIIFLNPKVKASSIYSYFESSNIINIHSKSISKIIFFLKQDFPNI